ncbi:putative MnhB-related membrane protein [Bradyrhizobium sp. i1.3.6]
MNIATVFEIALAAVVLGLAIWTIAVPDTYSATVGFIAYGLLVALIWVRLDAVDVALTEAAIGGGLGGVVLLGAAARLRDTEAMTTEGPSLIVRLSAAILSASIAAALAVTILLLPDPAPTLAPSVVANAGATGMTNPVTNVLMAFRGMDTMLEKVVLLLAHRRCLVACVGPGLGRSSRTTPPG